MKQLFRQLFKVPYVVLWNIFLVLVCYMVCRVVFLLENWSLFEMDMTWENALCLFQGGLLFDGSAIAYMNLLYVAMSAFPFHLKETDVWQAITKWTYVVPNAFGIIANLADSVYYPSDSCRGISESLVFGGFGSSTHLRALPPLSPSVGLGQTAAALAILCPLPLLLCSIVRTGSLCDARQVSGYSVAPHCRQRCAYLRDVTPADGHRAEHSFCSTSYTL